MRRSGRVAAAALFRILSSKRAVWICAACLIGAFLLRVTIRDRFLGLSGLFYMTPFPLQIAGWVFLLAVACARRYLVILGFSPIAVAVCGALWWHVSWVPRAASVAADPEHISVMLWNTARGANPDAMEDVVSGARPDICGLVEAGSAKMPSERWQEALGPDYDIKKLPGGMLVMVRGKIRPFVHRKDYFQAGDHHGRFARVTVDVAPDPGRQGAANSSTTSTLSLILCDIHSWPFYDKSMAFTKLKEAIRDTETGRLIVMGDFNTPLESRFFDELKDLGLYNAFSVAGHGWSETWGWGLPIVAIDQIWLGSGLAVHQAAHGGWKGSDHRPVFAYLR
jgi:hypothetical protein